MDLHLPTATPVVCDPSTPPHTGEHHGLPPGVVSHQLLDAAERLVWPCVPGSQPVPSYLGHRYLQQHLASQG